MNQLASLFEPIVEVRDVLESFLADQVLLEGWQATLASASRQFDSLGRDWSNRHVITLGQSVMTLVAGGLHEQTALAQAVSGEVAQLLDMVTVPGLPRPQDVMWEF